MPRFQLPDLPKLAIAAMLAAIAVASTAPAYAEGPLRRLFGRNNDNYDRAPRRYADPPVVQQPPVIIVEDQVPDVPNYAPRATTTRTAHPGTREFSDSDTGYHRFGRSVVQRRGGDSWDAPAGYDRFQNDRYEVDRYDVRRTDRDRYPDRSFSQRSDVRSTTRSEEAQAGYFEEDQDVERARSRRSMHRDENRPAPDDFDRSMRDRREDVDRSAVRDRSFADQEELLPPPRDSRRADDDRQDEFDRTDRDAAADRDAEPRFRDRPVRSRDDRNEEPAESFSEREDRAGADLLPPVPPED